MQSSSLPSALFETDALASPQPVIDLTTIDLVAKPQGSIGAASALLAPVAMLAGALGLLGLWNTVSRTPMLAPNSPAPQAVLATPHQSSAVEQAAVRDSQALSRLLADLGAPAQLAQPPVIQLTATAAQTVAALHEADVNFVSAADLDAQIRLRDIQATFRSTGLDDRPYLAPTVSSERHGGAPQPFSPLELRDVRVLGSRLNLEPGLARQVQRTARDLIAVRALSEAASALPLSTPVDDPVRSSPFGTRTDPFTHQAAFHPGQDFSGHYGQPIHVTAPGVISFVGQRSGYGNCVEVDHGHGFKTRYGHLSGFTAGVGQVLKTGDVIGRMGSTGRSTGVHLHYEVWASGRLQDPARFLKFPDPPSQRS